MGFMDLAKQGYEAYQGSQNDNQSQSQHLETPSHPGCKFPLTELS